MPLGGSHPLHQKRKFEAPNKQPGFIPPLARAFRLLIQLPSSNNPTPLTRGPLFRRTVVQ
jgi:hypothetical protein